MLRTAAALSILGVFVAFLVSLEDPEFRFGSAGNARQCLANQIINMPEDPDIVLLGSSRLRRGVSPEQMVEDLGGDLKVYNLGRSGFSTPRSYVLLRTLYDKGARPSVVVVEAELEAMRGVFARDKVRQRADWKVDSAAALGFRDMLDIPRSVFDAGVFGQMAFVGAGIARKIEMGIEQTLTGERVKVAPGQPVDTVCMLKRFDAPDDKRLARQERAKKQYETAQAEVFGDLDTALDDRHDIAENSYTRAELAYLQRIRDLVDAHGGELLVVRLFPFRSPPISDTVRTRLTELVPEHRSPPESLYREVADMFADVTHFNRQGREIYTRWLSTEIETLRADR